MLKLVTGVHLPHDWRRVRSFVRGQVDTGLGKALVVGREADVRELSRRQHAFLRGKVCLISGLPLLLPLPNFFHLVRLYFGTASCYYPYTSNFCCSASDR